MDWKLLGIQPVRDKKAITAAYRAKLADVNPEDKPEEFKALRAAYEQALEWAAEPEAEPVRDESPVGLWLEQVRALYDDFPARIRPENWRALLSQDVCVALDKRSLARDGILRFLMDDYFIPQPVWQLLDEAFGLQQAKDELLEHYPKDFVEYAVMNGIRYAPRLPYEMFAPGRDGKACDEYIRLYGQANRVAPGEMGPTLEKMDATGESHPYGEALKARLMLENGDEEGSAAAYRTLAEAWPQDTVLCMVWAAVCARSGDWAESEKYARMTLDVQPDHGRAKRLLADCLAERGEFDQAKDIIYDLMHDAGGDQMQLHQLNEVLRGWNDRIIEQREKTLAEHPDDSNNALELAWCYLQNDEYDDALRAAGAADPGQPDQYAYHNLWAKLQYGRQDYEDSLVHLQRLDEILCDMQPDGTDETAKRIRRRPEMIQLAGSCLLALGRRAEAREKIMQALELAPENPEILTYTGRMLYFEKDYERAAEVLGRLADLSPGAYHAHYLYALALFDMGRDREAFDEVNRALELEGSDLGVYVLKMRVLLRNGVWDEVHSVLDFLREHEVGNDLSVLWCAAQLTEFENKEEEKALEEYLAIAARVEAGEDFAYTGPLYFRIAVLTGGKLDSDKAEDRKQLLDILEKGLAADKDDEDCTDYKAWLLKRSRENDAEAIELYHKLEQLPRHNISVERSLAELYYRDLVHNAEPALKYYRWLLAKEEHPDLYFYVGTCLRYLRRWDEAEASFLREQELAPDDIDGFNGLAYVYEGMGEAEKALEQVGKAIALVDKRDKDYSWLYMHQVKLLRRLARPQDAIRAVNEAVFRYEYKHGWQKKLDICFQFGLWDQAKKLLSDWGAKAGANSHDVLSNRIQLNLYTGHLLKVRLDLPNLPIADRADYERDLAALSGNQRRVRQYWAKRVDCDDKEIGDLEHALLNLARCEWQDGNAEKAAELANRALELIRPKASEPRTNQLLFAARIVSALALAGRIDEAREALAAARTLPLCENCSLGECKDLHIYEQETEWFAGNLERALQLCIEGAQKWPDDIDFPLDTAELKKRMKRK